MKYLNSNLIKIFNYLKIIGEEDKNKKNNIYLKKFKKKICFVH